MAQLRRVQARDLSVGSHVYGALAEWTVEELNVRDGVVSAEGHSRDGSHWLLHRALGDDVQIVKE